MRLIISEADAHWSEMNFHPAAVGKKNKRAPTAGRTELKSGRREFNNIAHTRYIGKSTYNLCSLQRAPSAVFDLWGVSAQTESTLSFWMCAKLF